jgi:hypothetical protein
MKKIYYSAWSLLLTISGFAQLPQGMTFQAVIYSDDNQLMRDSTIGVRFSILQGEELIYAERHQPMTNSNGHIALIIGTGTAELGTYSDTIPYAHIAQKSLEAPPAYAIDIHGQSLCNALSGWEFDSCSGLHIL